MTFRFYRGHRSKKGNGPVSWDVGGSTISAAVFSPRVFPPPTDRPVNLVANARHRTIAFRVYVVGNFFPHFVVCRHVVVVRFSSVNEHARLRSFSELRDRPYNGVLYVVVVFRTRSKAVMCACPVFRGVVISENLRRLAARLRARVATALIPACVSARAYRALGSAARICHFVGQE